MADPGSRVVVTGGAGFIGSNLCRELRRRGVEVGVIDDLSTGSLDNLDGLDVEFTKGTILDPDALAAVSRHAASIVHLAARPSVPRSLQEPVATHAANATGTLLVLEAARASGAHVIVASSSSVYGANREMPKRESATPIPMSPYAVSKLAAESYALAYQRCFGVPVLAFRFFNVYGPLQAANHAYAAVVPRFIDAALAGRPLSTHGDGTQTRDFTFVGTVAEILAEAAINRTAHDGPVNLAFGSRTSINELIEHLSGLMGRALLVEHVEARPGDVRDSQADSTLLRSLFPTTVGVALVDGLQRTIEWFRSGSVPPS